MDTDCFDAFLCYIFVLLQAVLAWKKDILELHRVMKSLTYASETHPKDHGQMTALITLSVRNF